MTNTCTRNNALIFAALSRIDAKLDNLIQALGEANRPIRPAQANNANPPQGLARAS